MSRNLTILVVMAFLAAAISVRAQQQPSSAPSQNQSAPTASANSSNAPGSAQAAAPTDNLAEAARKARAAKQESPKTPRVFTNDNIPTTGGISSVGSASDNSSSSATASSSSVQSGSSYPGGDDETGWRKLFADLHHKLEQDQALVDVSQRELGNLSVQYYSDPTKAMMQQLTRSDINKKNAAIEQHKKDVEADKQAIDDAEDALRRAGGDPGWSSQ